MTLDMKGFTSLTDLLPDDKDAGEIEGFGRIRIPRDMNNDNTVGSSMIFLDLSYQLIKGLDIILAEKFTTGSPAETRVGMQYAWAKDGFAFYTMASRKLNENPDTDFKFDIGYNGPMSANWGWRTNWEQFFTFPDGKAATNLSRVRLGLTYQLPGSGTVVSFGPALDINNIQNGENAPVNPRTMMPGAYVSVLFK
jgi:hypothetical protein